MRASFAPCGKSLNVQYGSEKLLGSKTCAVWYATIMKTQSENLTVEINPLDEQRAAVLDSLTSYQPIWSSYRSRNERTAGLDAKLGLEWRVVNGHMNGLLEKYFCLTAGVELEVVRTEEDVLAHARREQEEAAWAEYGQD